MVNDEKIRKLISEMVEKIVGLYRPVRIILFGSYAYGEPDGDSNIDC